MNALNASLPTSGSYGAGTRRVLAPVLAEWRELLGDAGAPELAAPRTYSSTPGSESFATITTDPDTSGQVAPAPRLSNQPASIVAELRALGERQGRALAQWVADGREDARNRFRDICDTFRDAVAEVRRRARQLRGEVEESVRTSAESVRDFLHRWAEGAMEIHRDMMDALGQVAWGAGAVIALVGVVWWMSRRRGAA